MLNRVRYAAVRIGAVILIISGILQMFSTTQTLLAQFIGRQQREREIAAWVVSNIPEPTAQLYLLDLHLTLRHTAPQLTVIQVYDQTPERVEANLKTHPNRPTYALYNLYTLESQWKGRAPFMVYQALARFGLVEIGKMGGYTLWRVRS
jgi:hypothetical protein